MFKGKKNFLFIILISAITLVLLIVGAMTLYEDTSSIFTTDGYILDTTAETKSTYYFSANTKYKENVDEEIAFSDTDSNSVTVDTASFVHYSDGSIAFLQRGALVNLADITSSMVSYYNITTSNVISYDNGNYVVTSNGKSISMESFIGRISDSKYIIAGSNLSLKVPTEDATITGDYFEILYIEDGIVKIDNEDCSYQVTAQSSYVYVGDNITINLGDGKIYYDGEAKMLLSQITINGDENIDLDVSSNSSTSGGGTGSGSGGSGDGSDGDGTDGDTTTDTDSETGVGTGTGTGTGSESGTDSLQIELIEAVVTSTTIDLSLQLNNASSATGPVVAYLTNVSNGNKATPVTISLVNGTFTLSYESLLPSTEYTLSIIETAIDGEVQYFQKTFKTNDLGVTLEKIYATDDSLSYKIIFDENSEVSKVHVTIYDSNGTNSTISPNEYTISSSDIDTSFTFTGLTSNTNYSISVDTVWINNTSYSNTYTINRIDTTLKETPTLSGIDVSENADEVKFTISLENVSDPDNSIVSYTYNIYLADDITSDNTDPEVQYSVTKTDTDALVLNLNEIDELKTGVDYRCKIIASYNDNEMIREVSTGYSGNFLIKSKPSITWELESATMNKVTGTISLIDANCTVPISGRSCLSEKNTFTLRYYNLKDSESTENDTVISFDSRTLTYKATFSDLSSNTTYAVKVFGNYYDDDGVLHTSVQLGDTFYITTDKSDQLTFEVVGDNISGTNKDGTANSANVVTFDARLVAPQDSDVQEEISTITLNLYSGKYNVSDKLIGTYTVTSSADIEDFFSNITIKNSLFTDTTSNNLGLLDTLTKMITVTGNSAGTLNSAYTVEVADVYDSTGKNEIYVENNVYTFYLTSSYYLDARIESNSSYSYITTSLITKENLTDSEYETLAKTVSNLDDLNDDTVVGITIENSLSDTFVDSAFTYEKAIVNYTIYNVTTGKEIATVSVDMGNKYQPKTQTIYLDSSELDDGENYFTRGYIYKVGYTISFVTEDGSNPTYSNDKLYKRIAIERQAPIYTQYISTSDATSITYRYSMTDIDSALADNHFYYTLGDDTTYKSASESLVTDGSYHKVTISFDEETSYSLYYAKIDTSNKTTYVSIATYDFEGEYTYNNETSFTIVDEKDNVLKIKLDNNDYTERAATYKVVIEATDTSDISNYVRYFLASKLSTLSVDTGETDEEGNAISESYSYIAIDYANISKFMGHELKVSVYCYYDSGLVGLDQTFTSGLIFKNGISSNTNALYLNTYNNDSKTTSTSSAESNLMGMYLLKTSHSVDDENIYIYNQLMDTKNYDSLLGASYYDASTSDLPSSVGINYEVSYSNAGVILTNGTTSYTGYNAKVLKEAKLTTNDDTYKFETITPIINVTTNNCTINSIKIQMTASGIYGSDQFKKDGSSHHYIYVSFYSDEDLENLLTTLTTTVSVIGTDETGYQATISSLEYTNLIPDTTYYFTVNAYIDGEYTRLYDSSSTTTYVTKTYSATTLGSSTLIYRNDTITFSVEPTSYNGESSLKTLTWKFRVNSTDNYKLRFELYEPNGTTTDSEGNTVTTYKQVNFDGTEATSCDTSLYGDSSTGYVNGCYISVSMDDISSINNKKQTYTFTGDDFVFGGNYYKLVVYAIPYYSNTNSYNEDYKVLLYENDSLTTVQETSNGVTHNIKIPTLAEAIFSLNNTLEAGYSTSNGYYITFVPVVTDTYKVIKYGTYTVKLKNEKGEVVQSITGIDASIVNPDAVTFTGLSSNTLYYVELTYETYRNNVGYTEAQKTATTDFTDFIYTPVASNITLGTITASYSGTANITLTYNGSSNLSKNITRVKYTISLKGGSSSTSGEYVIDGDNSSIFSVTGSQPPKLTITTSDSSHSSNTSFSLSSGNTYIITTSYYYEDEDGDEILLEDQETGNSNYTTILNT